MDIFSLFTTLIYQPFFNVLVGFYWLLGLIPGVSADMGIAVIFLTILIRLILLPISLSGERTKEDRRKIAEKMTEIEEVFSADPIKMEAEKKRIMKKSRSVIVGEVINLIIQVAIALMLWKIFWTGLIGKDIHLIYSFMPEVELPFNLMFLGKYDLTHTSLLLNLLQSVLIFVLETISLTTSPYYVSKKEVVRMQLTLPIVSFIVFMALPAGKKLFIITSLVISIIIVSFKAIRRKYLDYVAQQEAKEKELEAKTESLVVK
jgi:YidC/Oxa1 family membrane protein insertase